MQTYFKYKLSSVFSGNKKGFTLIELIVVVAIMAVIITTLVIQQNKWNDRLVVNTQAYELALMVRQAQIYSLGVKEYAQSTGDKFDLGYGVYFSTNTSQYIFFADINKNQKYDSGEVVETKVLTRGVTIKDVCGASLCFFTGGGSLRQANISFFRPETKANIKLMNNGGGAEVDIAPVTIYLQSAGGKVSSVRVESSGQVSITQ